MSDAGYTLAETLAALMILGLAIGGLSTGVYVLGRQQAKASSTVGDVQALRGAERQIEHLLEAGGAFRSSEPERFSGDAQAFSFVCGQARKCTITLGTEERLMVLDVDDGTGSPRRVPLRTSGPGWFSYRSSLGATSVWPPTEPDRQALTSVTLMGRGDGEDLAIFVADVWATQPGACAFDPVLQDCR